MILTPEDTIEAQGRSLPEPQAPPPSFLDRFKDAASSATKAAAKTYGAIEDSNASAARAIAKPVSDFASDITAPGGLDRLSAGFAAGLNRERKVDAISADDRLMQSAYDPLVEAVNKGRAPEDQIVNPYSLGEYGDVVSARTGRTIAGVLPTRDAMERALWQRMDQLRTQDPGAAGNLPASRADLVNDVTQQQRDAAQADAQTAASSPSAGAGSFAGQLVGGTTEPQNVMALALGGGASESLLRTFVTEGSLNATLDAASLPSRLPRYQRMGQPLSAGDVAEEEAGDFLLGGAIPTGAKLAGMGGRALLDAFHARVPDAPPIARTAAAVVENSADLADANPHAATPQGEDITRQALDARERAAAQPPDADPVPIDTTQHLDRALDTNLEVQQRKSGFSVQSFDPSTLQTDAAAMQYKSGGDESGVTDRLQGVQQWDPAKAGLSLIWERENGDRVIADGHQRLGLAQRLQAEGQDTPFFGVNYREADGYTAPMMRVMAAAKNIAEGSGSALDAARVLRDAPELAGTLPPRSGLVRQANDIAKLGDDAFGMAWNGVASERDAALVGKHVSDPAMQSAILSHLSKDSPDTAEEAELFVRQAKSAGAAKQVQSDMFGDYLKADLVLPERVKILKSALTSLRKDKALFATLTAREGRIADAGNVLDTAANAAHHDNAAQAFTVLKALAERKGPISDALQSAAERSAQTRTGAARGAAVHDFLATVRSAARRGDLDGDGAGGAIGDLGPETESAGLSEAPRADTRLELFGDPAGKPKPFLQQSKDLARELAPEARDTATSTFKTSKGSTYEVFGDGTTARNKSFHPEHGAADVGPQPRSDNTYYVTSEQADALSLFQTQGRQMAIAALGDGRIGVKYLDGEGAGKFERRTVTKPSPEPALGLTPVELFDGGMKVHFGNEITEVSQAARAAEETAAKPEFGPAQSEVDALRALDQDSKFPDPAGAGEISVKQARQDIERQARAVERLRSCVED